MSPLNSAPLLSPEQIEVALTAYREYRDAPPIGNYGTPIEIERRLDDKRVALIENVLKPLLANYFFAGNSLEDFKRQIDGINKRHPLWGFKGIKGQMFFNQLTNTAANISELDGRLKLVLKEPETDHDASGKLQSFKAFVAEMRDQFIQRGGDPRSTPRASSVPFFVSYFWQIQNRDTWPIYYTNSVQTLVDMNLWRPTGEFDDDFISYKALHEFLQSIIGNETGQNVTLYDVEHVFWFKSGKPLVGDWNTEGRERPNVEQRPPSGTLGHAAVAENLTALPDSFVPPIVAVIPALAVNDAHLQEVARRSGTTLEYALEKSINAAFTVLGYEAQQLGQGRGRVPDGQAIAAHESYAVLWDGKARADGYRMGTDDRVIRQYIDTQSRSLKRNRSLRNIYYVLISSSSRTTSMT